MSSTKQSNSTNLLIALVYLLSTLMTDEIFNSKVLQGFTGLFTADFYLVLFSVKTITGCGPEQQRVLTVSSSGLLNGLTKKGSGQYPDLEGVPHELVRVSYHLRMMLMHILHGGTVSA